MPVKLINSAKHSSKSTICKIQDNVGNYPFIFIVVEQTRGGMWSQKYICQTFVLPFLSRCESKMWRMWSLKIHLFNFEKFRVFLLVRTIHVFQKFGEGSAPMTVCNNSRSFYPLLWKCVKLLWGQRSGKKLRRSWNECHRWNGPDSYEWQMVSVRVGVYPLSFHWTTLKCKQANCCSSTEPKECLLPWSAAVLSRAL